MHVGINALIAQQRGDPVCEVKAWLEKIGEADSKRNGFQDMAAERELEALRSHQEEAEEFKRDRSNALLSS